MRSRHRTTRPGKRRKKASVAAAPLTRESVQSIIRNAFGDWVPDDRLRFISVVSDERYIGADLDWLLGLIVHDPVLLPSAYRQDVFDCDDFAFYVKTRASLFAENNHRVAPLAVGVLLTDVHAYNICIAGNATLTLVNTQSDDRATSAKASAFGSFLSLGPANSIRLIYL